MKLARRLGRFLPVLEWLPLYRRADLLGDGLAGAIVAVMLVPQGMAYAMLAGLPAQVGLYASVIPVALYALLGTSRTLAVGPVAMVSLLVATGVGPLASAGTPEYVGLAITLALMVGVIQLGMGLLRLGFLTSLLSHPVLSGFTSAAAILIASSQLKHLLGVSIPRSPHLIETLGELARALPQAQAATLAVGSAALLLLLSWPRLARAFFDRRGSSGALANAVAKSAPLLAVVLGITVVSAASLAERAGVAVVGEIPRGLPVIAWPAIEPSQLMALLPTAGIISLVAFMESIAVAKTLASKRRQKVAPNQELIALGVANLGAAFSGAYPVTGGFSRSVVNFDAGARTGMSSLITALLVALTLAFLTPLLHDLPRAVLAAIVVVAVAKLVDFGALRAAWRYGKAEAASLLVTFLAVLFLGVEVGILAGAGTALVLFLARTYRPHVAIVGRVAGTEHFRNVERHAVETCPEVVAVRIDESLYFLNFAGLEERLMQLVAESDSLRDLVLICSAVNGIDSSALEGLEQLAEDLEEAGVRLHLTEVKGPVMDKLRACGFVERFGAERIHLSTFQAMEVLGCRSEGEASSVKPAASPRPRAPA